MCFDREHRTILAELLELKAPPATVAFPIDLAARDALGKYREVAIAMLSREFVHHVIELGIASAVRVV
jgi:hypothetical protein